MQRIPEDERGRCWMQGHFPNEATASAIRKIIGTLISVDGDGCLDVLGTSFVIRDSRSQALCLGAAHSFNQAKRSQQARGPISHPTFPKEIFGPRVEHIDPGKIHAVFLSDGEPVICKVSQPNYIEGNDVAVFAVSAPEEQPEFFTQHASIDLSAPDIDNEVLVCSHDVEKSELFFDGKASSGKLALRYDMRSGVVFEVALDIQTGLQEQSFIFYTTAPTTPGMSGAPVVHMPVEGGKFTVRGVVSTDISEDEAFDSFMVAGRSSHSMLWPAMGLGLHVNFNGEDRFWLLGELLEANAFDNRTPPDVRVTTETDGKQVVIQYTDARSSKHICLKQDHPLAHT